MLSRSSLHPFRRSSSSCVSFSPKKSPKNPISERIPRSAVYITVSVPKGKRSVLSFPNEGDAPYFHSHVAYFESRSDDIPLRSSSVSFLEGAPYSFSANRRMSRRNSSGDTPDSFSERALMFATRLFTLSIPLVTSSSRLTLSAPLISERSAQ